MTTIAFHLNGLAVTINAAPDRRLIDILRDDLDLTASKRACGIGRCGGCAVLMDDRLVNACLVMAWQLEGRDVVSPEGFEALPEAAAIRTALIAENAFQCGYCAPGMTAALIALFRDRPRATEDEIRAGLEGNICRCTGYQSILRAALKAQAALSP